MSLGFNYIHLENAKYFSSVGHKPIPVCKVFASPLRRAYSVRSWNGLPSNQKFKKQASVNAEHFPERNELNLNILPSITFQKRKMGEGNKRAYTLRDFSLRTQVNGPQNTAGLTLSGNPPSLLHTSSKFPSLSYMGREIGNLIKKKITNK